MINRDAVTYQMRHAYTTAAQLADLITNAIHKRTGDPLLVMQEVHQKLAYRARQISQTLNTAGGSR